MMLLGHPFYESSGFADLPVNSTTAAAYLTVTDLTKSYIIFDRMNSATVELVPHLFDPSTGRPIGQRGAYYYWRVWRRRDQQLRYWRNRRHDAVEQDLLTTHIAGWTGAAGKCERRQHHRHPTHGAGTGGVRARVSIPRAVCPGFVRLPRCGCGKRETHMTRWTTAGFIVLAVPGFSLVACDSDPGGGGTSSSNALTATVTGTVSPQPASVGQPELFDVTYAKVSGAIANLTIDVNSDMTDNHTVDGVVMAVAAAGATPDAENSGAPCTDDGGGTRSCGAVKAGGSAEVILTAVPKNAGNFSPEWQTFTDTMGTSDWADISPSGDVTWREKVNP